MLNDIAILEGKEDDLIDKVNVITLCEKCANYISEDGYCKVLQINWLPTNFGCNKGENTNERNI